MFGRSKAPALYDSAAPPKVGRTRRLVSWWMGSTKTLIASVVVLLIVAALGIYLVLVPAPDLPSRQSAQSSGDPVVAAPTESVTTQAAVVCPEQPSVEVAPETLVLTTYSTKWYAIGEMLAPTSKTAGPQQSGTHQCFARTPEGALYAIATRVAIEASKAGASGRQFSGYQWLSYSPALATVSIAARAVNGDNAEPATARTFTATWVGSDWQVGVVNQPVEYLDGLRTFTTWGGA